MQRGISTFIFADLPVQPCIVCRASIEYTSPQYLAVDGLELRFHVLRSWISRGDICHQTRTRSTLPIVNDITFRWFEEQTIQHVQAL